MKHSVVLCLFLIVFSGCADSKSNDVAEKEGAELISPKIDNYSATELLLKYQEGKLTLEELIKALPPELLKEKSLSLEIVSAIKKDQNFLEKLKGERGETGSIGPRGVEGAKGEKGDTGTNGLKGERGKDGVAASTIDVREYGVIFFGTEVSREQKKANTATIQAAIDNFSGSGAKILLPEGIIYLEGSVNVRKDRTHIHGAGIYATTIYSDAGVLFNFDKGEGGTLFQCSIEDLSILGATTAQKIAIRITDVDVMEVNNISIGTWNGERSIGLQYRGRDALVVSKTTIFADRPISIEDNPNSTIDIDHAHFSDLYLGADEGPDTTEACVSIDTGVNLTQVTFDGYQAWVLGKYGLYWKDTTTTGTSASLNLKNIRWEQSSTAADGYIIYISHNYNLQNLSIDNIYGASNQEGTQSTNGIYLHNISGAAISNSIILAGEQGSPRNTLSFDNTTFPIIVSNVLWTSSGGIKSIGSGLLPKIFIPRDGNSGVNYAVYDLNAATETTLINSPLASSSVLVENGGIIDIHNGEGLTGVLIVNTSGGPNGIYSLRGSIATLEMLDPDNWFTPVKDSEGSVNIYWSEANSRYELQNLLGSSLKFSWFIMGTSIW